MPGIVMTTVIFIIMSVLIYLTYIPQGVPGGKGRKKEKSGRGGLYAVLFAGIILRYTGAFFEYGHSTDMNCFSAWALRMAEVGPGKFYSPDVFTDYPPGYMYIMWIIGFIKKLIPMGDTAFGMLLKTPAIVADILTAAFLYNMSRRSLNNYASCVIAFFAVVNPAIYINSAMWGQVDSIFTFLVLVCLHLIAERKLIQSFFVFALAVIVKPQALFYTPVILFAIAQETVYPKVDIKKLLKYIAWGVGAIVFALLLSAPFGVNKVLSQYVGTLSSYQYKTVNAFNMWSMLGGNWEKLTTVSALVSTLAIIFSVLYAMKLFFCMNGRDKYFYTAAVICIGVFVFATKMHERYCYPALVFLLAAVALKPNLLTFGLYTAVSALQFFNTASVFYFFNKNFTAFHDRLELWGGIFALLLFALLVYTSYTLCGKRAVRDKSVIGIIDSGVKDYRINKKDVILMTAVTVIYAAVAFCNLGDMNAPESGVISDGGVMRAEFLKGSDIKKIMLYPGSYNISSDNAVTFTFCGADGESIEEITVDDASVFCWYEKETAVNGAYSVTASINGKAELMEAAFINAEGEAVKIKGEEALFDEQELVPNGYSFKNSTYFDEIYHARTAYEFIKDREAYEWTHPPLGKSIISIGIRIFGMNPFGWRFMGTLFGVLMVPVMYIFAKKLLGKTSLALFSAVLFTFDFMHFAQTRIATIDVYITFFIMLMYLFMLLYLKTDIYGNLKRQTVFLALCGICMGLGISCKWTGMYAGAGLGVLFFARLVREYTAVKENNKTEFTAYTKKIIPLCVVFFVIVPAVIYALSYIPFVNVSGGGFGTIIKNQKDMFSYHSQLEATHSFSSAWYEWPIMVRPVWYYSNTVSDGIKEGISSFGNPIVWWCGIPAFFCTVYTAIRRKDRVGGFLAIAYLAQLLPWMPVERCTFIYHYFPSVPFVVLMIAYTVQVTVKDERKRMGIMVATGILCIILFGMFYPVLSGQAASVEYVKEFLKWFGTWQLI